MMFGKIISIGLEGLELDWKKKVGVHWIRRKKKKVPFAVTSLKWQKFIEAEEVEKKN